MRAELSGSTVCIAAGIVCIAAGIKVETGAPVLAMCRIRHNGDEAKTRQAHNGEEEAA